MRKRPRRIKGFDYKWALSHLGENVEIHQLIKKEIRRVDNAFKHKYLALKLLKNYRDKMLTKIDYLDSQSMPEHVLEKYKIVAHGLQEIIEVTETIAAQMGSTSLKDASMLKSIREGYLKIVDLVIETDQKYLQGYKITLDKT